MKMSDVVQPDQVCPAAYVAASVGVTISDLSRAAVCLQDIKTVCVL